MAAVVVTQERPPVVEGLKLRTTQQPVVSMTTQPAEGEPSLLQKPAEPAVATTATLLLLLAVDVVLLVLNPHRRLMHVRHAPILMLPPQHLAPCAAVL